jgi:phosphopantetheine adenylyltransferase
MCVGTAVTNTKCGVVHYEIRRRICFVSAFIIHLENCYHPIYFENNEGKATRNSNLAIVLYGRETWPFALEVSENRNEVTEQFRILHNE